MHSIDEVQNARYGPAIASLLIVRTGKLIRKLVTFHESVATAVIIIIIIINIFKWPK